VSSYREFIRSKRISAQKYGFDPGPLNANLFDWQAPIVRWSLQRGKAALFEDCGLGKTIQQLEWSRWVNEHTRKPVLILAPILVGWQTVEQSSLFSIEADCKQVREQSEVIDGINVTNYERLHLFDASKFGGVVLDESSILKSFMGKRKQAIIEHFERTPFKLSCTATPSPNDLLELGNQADFLDVMPSREMIARWFCNDPMHAGKYRLKNHGQEDFWRWVSTWAVSLSSPEDLGFDGSKFKLPPLVIDEHWTECGESWFGGDNKTSNASATMIHSEKRASLETRCLAVGDVVAEHSGDQFAIWCGTNYEADELIKVLGSRAVEVRGNHSESVKEERLKAFQHGLVQCIITKPKIGGFGLNWQHSHRATWFPTYSFEEAYQAWRRQYRFGQEKPVTITLVASENESGIVQALKRKANAHIAMRSGISDAMRDFQIAEIVGNVARQEYNPTMKVSVPSWLKPKA
jgi:hypothetical protein